MYSADHHSVTTTIGTGADAISSTTFTDTTGAVVLSIDGEQQKTIYARNQQGLLRRIIDPLARVTEIEYDALDRPFRTTRPDGSFEVTVFDAAGNLTDRIMNNALGWYAEYDTAGRQTLETTYFGNSTFSRVVQHTYLSSGANTGLRNTTSDQRGVTFTHAYDDFRRLESITALRWQLNAGRRVDDEVSCSASPIRFTPTEHKGIRASFSRFVPDSADQCVPHNVHQRVLFFFVELVELADDTHEFFSFASE